MPAGASGRTAALSAERLASLHPIVTLRGRCMVDLCAEAGLALLVTQGLRTWAEQDALYAQGRTRAPIGKKHIVTNARGGQSWHNFGLAFDIVVLDAVGKANWDSSHPGWRKAAELGKSVGLEWGGDWRGFKDLPHFQYTGGLTLAQCRALHPGGLAAVWEKVQ
jgi:peptidoglycan L-alanyl-D-glutamate endopeptidase CwlK